LALVLVGFLMVPRLRARAELGKETLLMAVPSVSVVHPRRALADQDVVLPANIQAYTDAPIYARTNGYLKHWYVDIGAHVAQGQLLAEIDTPEIDQQLQQARADLATAEANAHLAEITALRYRGLLKTDSVSTQDADNATGDFEAKRAMLQSARANVQRLENLHSFKRIYAPFDGVITARNTDIGALIDSGSSGGTTRELFHIASASKLRVYVNVPQVYSQAAKPGLSAELTLAEFPGRRFPGKLVRTAEAIDTASRTLLAQINVDNPSGELLAGAFAQVHLKLPAKADSYLLPVNTLVFRSEGMRVAMVKEGRSVLVPVVLGRDFGTDVEVLAGLAASDDVIENPPDSLADGQEVAIAKASPEAAR
jgi:RND family efflux transporter MFP subunit